MHSSAAPAPDGLACARRLRSVSTTCPALSTAAAYHSTCNPLYTVTVRLQSKAGGGKPPSGKARSTWTPHHQPLSILLLLQPNLARRQIHFATFCNLDKLHILQRQIYLPPPLCTLRRSLYCACFDQLGCRSTASMEFGLFSETPNIHASACSSNTSFPESAPTFGPAIPIFWSQPLPGSPNLWEGSHQPADCDSQRQLKGPTWGQGVFSTIHPDRFTQLADNAKPRGE